MKKIKEMLLEVVLCIVVIGFPLMAIAAFMALVGVTIIQALKGGF